MPTEAVLRASERPSATTDRVDREDHVFTSKVEREFAEELDAAARLFHPLAHGRLHPGLSHALVAGKVGHIHFVAEVKGSMSSLELRGIETVLINCARKFFAKITFNDVKYDVVGSYEKAPGLVKPRQ